MLVPCELQFAQFYPNGPRVITSQIYLAASLIRSSALFWQLFLKATKVSHISFEYLYVVFPLIAFVQLASAVAVVVCHNVRSCGDNLHIWRITIRLRN